MPSGFDLSAEVAAVLDGAKWTIELEQDRAGIHIDLIAHDPSGEEVLIECKAYSQLAGLKTVRAFSAIVDFLRESTPELQAWLVTTRGFTPNAQKALARNRIEGVTIAELKRRYGAISGAATGKPLEYWKAEARKTRRRKRRVFAIMPFTAEMLDVYILGIRWAANRLGMVAERADDLEHNGEIIEEIRRAISEYDAILADTTGANPNVCYEVGYAHALDRPTILMCRKGQELPFDLKGTNHLFYENIISLREPLRAKLAAALNGDSGEEGGL